MKKRVLAIMGSPRKEGNCAKLFKQFVNGAKESGCEVEEVFLRELKISPCLEIYGCKKDGRCVIKDDFEAIYEQIIACDVFVLVSPVFFNALPAQVKAVIDRCQSFYMRKHHLKQTILPAGAPFRPAYLIALGGAKNKNAFEATFLTLEYFCKTIEIKLKDSLLYQQIEDAADIEKHPTALADAYKLGLSLGEEEK